MRRSLSLQRIKMASNASTECRICSETFTDEKHCPRILPCSHCLCSQCINQLIEKNAKVCPLCRRNFEAESSQDLLINRSLLEILEYVAELESTDKQPGHGGKVNQLAKMMTEFEEQNKKVSKENLSECQTATALINKAIRNNTNLRDDLLTTNTIIEEEILTKLQEITLKNGRQIEYFGEENGRLMSHLEGISAREKSIKDINADLKASSDFAAAAPTMVKADQTNKSIKEYLNDLKELLNMDQKTLLGIGKAALKIVGKITVVQEALTVSGEEEESDIDLTHCMAALAMQNDIPDDVTESIMAAEESDGPEYLINQSSHTCLAVISGTGVHDAVFGMSKCSGGTKQQWFPKNGQWEWGENRSLCLSMNNETGELCLASHDSVSGSWFHDQENRLTLGSKALEVPWKRPRTRVILYPKHPHVNQKWWTLTQLKGCLEDNHLVGEHCLPSSVLAICKKELGRAASKNTRAMKTQKECNCQGGNNFRMLSHAGDIISDTATASEFLVSQSTLTCLTVLSGTDPKNAIIGLSPFTGSMNQQWIVSGGHWLWGGNLSYCLMPDMKNETLKLGEVSSCKTSWNFDDQGFLETKSKVLDVPWQTPRIRVIIYPKHGGENQRWWKLSEVRSALQRDPATETNYPGPLVSMAEKVPDKIVHCGCQCKGKGLVDTYLAAEEATSEEPEYLISQSTHTCLTVLKGTCPNDATIGLAPYTGDAEQQWFVRDGVWQWGSNRSYCLAPDMNRGTLCLVSNTEANSSWNIDKSGFFMSGSFALDVPWEGGKTEVILCSKHGGINKKWWMLSSLKSCVGLKMYPFSANDENSYKQEMARSIVNRLCSLSELLPHPRDISHYPGTVAATTPRINMSCILTVGTVQQAKNLHMTVPEDWQATNMYVVAGDIFTVILRDSLTENQAEQITVRVGAHRDSLDPTSPNLENGVFKRIPVVSEEFDVNPGVNHLRSQFGGNLIFMYEGTESFKVTTEVRNIVETPHYKLGKTSSTEWKKMKELDAPFCVLETNKVVMIVPTPEARDILDLDDLLHRYDDVMKKLEDLAGFTENDAPPQGKQWLVDDVQITAGSAHAGFPAMFDHQYYALTSPETPHDWVVWHELGHNYQQGPFWSYAYGSESTVNLFSLYIEEKIKADDRLKRENKYMPTAKKVDNGLTFEQADCWQKLVFLMEIKHGFPSHGWDMYRHLNRTVRALSDMEATALRSSVQKQYDYVYSTLSRYIGIDLIPHYRRWSLPISQQVQNEVASLGLPKSPNNLLANSHPDQCVIA